MVPNNIPFTIGAEPKVYGFGGGIDEVAVYNKALSKLEIDRILDVADKTSACNPKEETPTNPTIEVTKANFRPISRDLAYHEETGVWYVMKGPVNVDINPPRLILPSTINKQTSESEMKVEYEGLRAFDSEENREVSISCSPQSGSIFEKRTTEVRCSAKDSSGNEAKGTFNVRVTDKGGINIASWIKDSAGWWGCEDSEYRTTDQEFIGALQWLIDEGIVIIPVGDATGGTGDSSVPSWVQFAACTWSQGISTDQEFANAIQHLIKEGIIKI